MTHTHESCCTNNYDRWVQRRKATAGTLGILPSAADLYGRPMVDYSTMAMRPGERRRPAWIDNEGLCFVGTWEMLGWRRYNGLATTWAEADYAFEHTQEFLDDLKALGCNSIIIPYDYGYGEAVNAGEIELSRELIKLAHTNGLRVGTYFRPDQVWVETLSDEELREIEGGFQVDARGHLIQPFGTASVNVCFNHPGVLNRLLRHIRTVIVDLKSDMLHLDGLIAGHLETFGACRCENCAREFRQYVHDRYQGDREVITSRFGHPCVEKLNPPASYPFDSAPFDGGATTPHWAEWIGFRCYATSRVFAEVAALTQALNPEVAIEINNSLPATRENAAMWTGTDVLGMGHYTDAHWSEDGYGPKLHDTGILTHRVRQFKHCRAANGNFALTYMAELDERGLRQNMAHAAAFNKGSIGCIGFPPHMNFMNKYTNDFPVRAAFSQWLNAHRALYTHTVSAAKIALWRPREGMALGGRMVYAAAMRMEQLLVESCRAFDIVFDESPANLAQYDLVIVPNVECMSLQQLEGFVQYVEQGGNLLIGQDSATFDLWFRRRIENPWAILFGDASVKYISGEAIAGAPAGLLGGPTSMTQGNEPVRVTYGQGRAVYVPQIADPATQPSLISPNGMLNCGFDYANWVVPDNAGAISEAIDWLMQEREPVRVQGERGLLAEFLTQSSPHRMLVHLVNQRHQPQACRVDVRTPEMARGIEVLAPPTDQPPVWRVIEEDGATAVVFDHLDTYALLMLNAE
jgi:hypothetical protein